MGELRPQNLGEHRLRIRAKTVPKLPQAGWLEVLFLYEPFEDNVLREIRQFGVGVRVHGGDVVVVLDDASVDSAVSSVDSATVLVDTNTFTFHLAVVFVLVFRGSALLVPGRRRRSRGGCSGLLLFLYFPFLYYFVSVRYLCPLGGLLLGGGRGPCRPFCPFCARRGPPCQQLHCRSPPIRPAVRFLQRRAMVPALQTEPSPFPHDFPDRVVAFPRLHAEKQRPVEIRQHLRRRITLRRVGEKFHSASLFGPPGGLVGVVEVQHERDFAGGDHVVVAHQVAALRVGLGGHVDAGGERAASEVGREHFSIFIGVDHVHELLEQGELFLSSILGGVLVRCALARSRSTASTSSGGLRSTASSSTSSSGFQSGSTSRPSQQRRQIPGLVEPEQVGFLGLHIEVGEQFLAELRGEGLVEEIVA